MQYMPQRAPWQFVEQQGNGYVTIYIHWKIFQSQINLHSVTLTELRCTLYLHFLDFMPSSGEKMLVGF